MAVILGIKGRAELTVTEADTARAAGSGSLEVFATPFMVALMEKAACESIQPYLEEGQSSVGTKLDVAHYAATPVGMRVWTETEVTGVDGRKITFSVKAYDEVGFIGEGTHERFLVFAEKFVEKCYAKKKK